jgi:hypothetical protein
VDERGQKLRQLSFAELESQRSAPIEHVTVGSRPATIGVIVQTISDGGIRVVVQGFMKAKYLGHHVALDGFYKYPDQTVTPMPNEEFFMFD